MWPAMFTTTAPSFWSRPGCSTCWRWWMFTRSPQGRKANAKGESEPFRSVDPVRAVRVGGDGDRDQENRLRARPVRAVPVRLLRRLADWLGLGDALRPRLDRDAVRIGRQAVRNPPQRS